MGLCLDLGSYSDMGASASLDFMIKVWHSVTSMLTVSIQVKETGLGLGFSVRKCLCTKYGYGQN